MPLNPRASLWSNAHEMMQAGHPRNQSFAAAYRVKGKKAPKPKLMTSLRAGLHLPRLGGMRLR